MKYVYVAGPYGKGDPVVNTRNAILVADKLSELGFVPFIPHLSLLWHMVSPHEVDFWYSYDNEWLKKCDALLRLPGESPGADAEVELAKSLGIPVFYSLSGLITAE
ncbi:MAG: DUF7768 domain-containing protein [Candidatus Hodarchaeales archaeon]|jgi:hypothetical protein